VEKDFGRVRKEPVIHARGFGAADPFRVIVDSVVLGQYDGQHQHPKVPGRVLELRWVAFVTIEMAFGFRTYVLCPGINRGQALFDVRFVADGKPASAEEVQFAEGEVTKGWRGHAAQFRQRYRTCLRADTASDLSR
jgi:hypothetical protein